MTSCNLWQSEEEKQREEEKARVNAVLDESKQVFESNKNFILAEIVFGVLCQQTIKETGAVAGPDCETYFIAQEIADETTDTGVLLLVSLYKEGYLTTSSPRYPEFEEIILQLIALAEEANAIRTDIDSYNGSDCVKCLM